MRTVTLCSLAVAVAAVAAGGDLASTLSPASPQDRAILAYLELAELKTATATDLTELGVLLADSGRLEEAERYLRKAVRADRHSFAAWYRLGLVQQRRGASHDAARTFARALRESPDDGYALFMLALAEERCGNRGAAIADYARAFRALPALANPSTNPLVLDSELQAAASLRYYKETVTARTMPLTALDPTAVKAMMSARPVPQEAPPPPAPAAAPAPLPDAEELPVPAPTPRPTMPPGAPGGPNPRGEG